MKNLEHMKLFLNLFLILILVSGCGNQDRKKSGKLGGIEELELFQAIDFTVPGEFTSGIEGPAVDHNGILYVVNYDRVGTIGMVLANGKAELFLDLPEGSTGNGIRFHSNGSMLVADYTGHNILSVDMDTKEVLVYVHGKKMNQPNDLAIASDNTLYLSDPDWDDSTGKLWKVDSEGQLMLLEDNMGTTNGVEVSPEDDVLYVNESVQRKVWAYEISAKGEISNKRLFYEFEDFGLDGMRCDKKGNLYITRYGKGTVVILSPGGTLLREIYLKGKKPSNISFGGKDGKTCYVTLQDRGCVEMFKNDVPGRDW
jgi:sugar lactone lactonase YvrE